MTRSAMVGLYFSKLLWRKEGCVWVGKGNVVLVKSYNSILRDSVVLLILRVVVVWVVAGIVIVVVVVLVVDGVDGIDGGGGDDGSGGDVITSLNEVKGAIYMHSCVSKS